MKPRYRYFWDYGQCGLELPPCNCDVCRGMNSYRLLNDPDTILIVRGEVDDCDYQDPTPGFFFAYEERQRLH